MKKRMGSACCNNAMEKESLNRFTFIINLGVVVGVVAVADPIHQFLSRLNSTNFKND